MRDHFLPPFDAQRANLRADVGGNICPQCPQIST
jgi:hypothetical protein